jgi:hypothetical protein
MWTLLMPYFFFANRSLCHKFACLFEEYYPFRELRLYSSDLWFLWPYGSMEMDSGGTMAMALCTVRPLVKGKSNSI